VSRALYRSLLAAVFLIATACAPHADAASSGVLAIVTSCDDAGAGTLRDVLANTSAVSEIDLSQLPCADRTIRITSGEIAFQNDSQISIYGFVRPIAPMGVVFPDVVIDAGGASRIFNQHGEGMLALTGVDLRNGFSGGPGGCVASEGGVSLTSSYVDGCAVVSTEFGTGVGGGIYATLAVSLDSTDVRGNSATGDSVVEGGGIATRDLAMSYSTLADNSAIATSVFGWGGGAYVSGNASIFASTISGNVATDIGGLQLLGQDGTQSLVIANSTISGNVGGSVGGVMALQSPIVIASSTIAFNTATLDTGTGGLIVGNPPQMQSTIAANNGARDVGATCQTPPCGFAIGGANNVIIATDLAAPADTITDDPELMPLADNGGLALTHAPGVQSVALDRGNDAVASLGFGTVDYDQRGPGYSRRVGVAIDVGAYEWSAPPDWLFADGFDCGESRGGHAPAICP
jgi:hypothetical protein